jgi:hypothetical protein
MFKGWTRVRAEVQFSANDFRRSLPAKPSGETFRRNLPAKPSGETFRRNLPAKPSGETFRRNLPVKQMRDVAAPKGLVQPLLELAPVDARAEKRGRDNWTKMWKAFFKPLSSKKASTGA